MPEIPVGGQERQRRGIVDAGVNALFEQVVSQVIAVRGGNAIQVEYVAAFGGRSRQFEVANPFEQFGVALCVLLPLSVPLLYVGACGEPLIMPLHLSQ